MALSLGMVLMLFMLDMLDMGSRWAGGVAAGPKPLPLPVDAGVDAEPVEVDVLFIDAVIGGRLQDAPLGLDEELGLAAEAETGLRVVAELVVDLHLVGVQDPVGHAGPDIGIEGFLGKEVELEPAVDRDRGYRDVDALILLVHVGEVCAMELQLEPLQE